MQMIGVTFFNYWNNMIEVPLNSDSGFLLSDRALLVALEILA